MKTWTGPVKTATTLPDFLCQPDLKLILFGGKGGVGKTTCAAATALHLAQHFPDRTYLAASIDPAHSLQDSFAGPARLPNLDIVEIDAADSLRRFKADYAVHIGRIAARGTFLDEHDIAQLLHLSMPGLDEIMAFREISRLAQVEVYSCIVVDTAPTGHTLRFLEMPQVLRRWVEALDAMLGKHRYMAGLYRGSYQKDDTDAFLEDLAASIGRLDALLRDPVRCRFVPAMLADPFSVNETERLLEKLAAMDINVAEVLVNLLVPSTDRCPVCADRHVRQRQQLSKLPEGADHYTLWEIPLQEAEVRGVELLADLWTHVGLLDKTAEADGRVADVPARVQSPAPLPGPEVPLLLFAGKGGVGKTTLAAATAFRLAHDYTDKEVLLFSTDPAHSLSDCVGTCIGPREVRIAPRLCAMEIDAQAEFGQLKAQYVDEVERFFASLTGGATVDLEFDREVIEHIMDLSPPGLDEVMALTRIVALLEKRTYDVFVLDTAPTGHLIRLLELPELIQQWLRVFFGLSLKYKNAFRLPEISEFLVSLSKRLKSLRTLLTSPKTGRLFAVSILTEMAFEETRDLLAACHRVGIHVPALFLNLATSPRPCHLCSAVAKEEANVRRKFRQALGHVSQTVVYRRGEPRGPSGLTTLGQALYRG